MSQITTQHKGFSITYADNQDVWRCYDLNVEAPTLSALRRKIDTVERKARQVENVPAFKVGWRGEVTPCVVTARVGKQMHPDGSVKRHHYMADGAGAWCLTNDGKRRERVKPSELIEDTPENRAMVERLRVLVRIARDAEKAAGDYLASIPRMSLDALQPEDPALESSGDMT